MWKIQTLCSAWGDTYDHLFFVSHLLWVCLHGLEITFRKTFRNVIRPFRDWDRDLNYVILEHVNAKLFHFWNAFPITIRKLRTASDILLLTTQSAWILMWPMRLCMASARIFKMHTHESRSKTALRLHGLESGFLGWITIQNALFFTFQNAFQKPDLKQLFVYMG